MLGKQSTWNWEQVRQREMGGAISQGNSVPLIPGVKAGNLSHQPEFPGAQLLGVVLCRSEQLTSQATTLQVRNYRQVSQNEVPCTVLEGGCGYKFSSF